MEWEVNSPPSPTKICKVVEISSGCTFFSQVAKWGLRIIELKHKVKPIQSKD